MNIHFDFFKSRFRKRIDDHNRYLVLGGWSSREISLCRLAGAEDFWFGRICLIRQSSNVLHVFRAVDLLQQHSSCGDSPASCEGLGTFAQHRSLSAAHAAILLCFGWLFCVNDWNFYQPHCARVDAGRSWWLLVSFLCSR